MQDNQENSEDVEVEGTSVNPEQLTKKQRRELKKENKQIEIEKKAKAARQKSLLTWLAVLVGLALIVWGIIAVSGNSNDGPVVISNSDISAQDHVKGNPNADITIIEYSDFQCPACASYSSVVGQLVEDYGDQIAFVYRHYPLSSIHYNATAAGEATEAASLQGKFWEMHDKLFLNQRQWSDLTSGNAKKEFVRYAGEIGLDIGQFETDLDSSSVRDRVRSDSQSALKSGLTGTPSFFVNGEKINNPRGIEEFKFIIDNLLQR